MLTARWGRDGKTLPFPQEVVKSIYKINQNEPQLLTGSGENGYFYGVFRLKRGIPKMPDLHTFLIVGCTILCLTGPARAATEGPGNTGEAAATPADVPAPDRGRPPAWVLVFEDRFGGGRLDTAAWEPVYGVPRDLDFRMQKAWHLPENLAVENGLLRLTARRDSLPQMPVVTFWEPLEVKQEDFAFSTAEVRTREKFHYGRYEARVRIPRGKGLWPAFWLFGGHPWNEIDIFEFWNEYDRQGRTDTTLLARVHHMNAWYDPGDTGQALPCSDSYTGGDFSARFHVFTMIWSPEHISWYVDGELKRVVFSTYQADRPPRSCPVFSAGGRLYLKSFPRDPMAIIFSLGIQSGGDAPDGSTPLPAAMEVDWVRYYRRVEPAAAASTPAGAPE